MKSCFVVAFRSRDVAPAGESLSFASPKESNQRKGDPAVCDPVRPRGERGNLGCSGAGCAVELTARWRAPFRQPRQISSRCGRVLRHARHPAPCAPQAHPEGSDSGHRFARPPGRQAFASLGQSQRRTSPAVGCAVRSTRAPRAEQSNGPSAAPTPCGCAEERRGRCAQACRRTRLPRVLTRRGCLNGAHAVRAASSTAALRPRAPQAAPFAPSGRRGTQTPGSPFLCLLSFGEAKESRCAAGRTSRPRKTTKRLP